MLCVLFKHNCLKTSNVTIEVKSSVEDDNPEEMVISSRNQPALTMLLALKLAGSGLFQLKLYHCLQYIHLCDNTQEFFAPYLHRTQKKKESNN